MKFRIMMVLVAALLSFAAVGCGEDSAGDSQDDAQSVDKPNVGKGDAVIAQICVEEGFEADCDLCEIEDWYNDGVCDEFCANPDPDCGGDDANNDVLVGNNASCTFGQTSPVGESSSDLDDLEVGRLSFTIDDIDTIPSAQAQQIYDAFILLQFINGDEDLDVVFDAADEGTIDVVRLEDGAAQYDWISFFAGDTEVGAIYEAGTLNRVGEISDGDIKGCGAGGDDANNDDNGDDANNDTPVEPVPVECSFAEPWPVADTSNDLEDFVTNERNIDADNADGLSDLDQRQIFEALVHLQTGIEGEDFDVVFDTADGGEFILSDVSASGQDFDWVTCFLGDTEVGVVFDADTLTIVAEISDGDILSCTAQ